MDSHKRITYKTSAPKHNSDKTPGMSLGACCVTKTGLGELVSAWALGARCQW